LSRLSARRSGTLPPKNSGNSTAATGFGSVTHLHVEHVPALGGRGLSYGCRVLIGNTRDAISVDLPLAGRGAVGRQQHGFRLRGRVAVDDVFVGVGRGGEHVQSDYCCGKNEKLAHDPLRSLLAPQGVRVATESGAVVGAPI
jgi:hypothetical protein